MTPSAHSVGVFDSGVGGLTVVAEIRRRLPGLDLVYFGDTARVPYGNKSPQTVRRYSREIAHFLVSRGVGHLVVACNTSSALALPELEATTPVPVLGMIRPGAEAAVSATKTGRIGLIGTRATVASGAYERAVHAIDPRVEVFSAACPLLVPLVEEGWAEDPVADSVVARYLAPLRRAEVDTLILGCTHYPALVPALQRAAGPSVRLISSSGAAAEALARQRGALPPAPGPGSLTCIVTDAGTYFREVAERILGTSLGPLEEVEEERLVLP